MATARKDERFEARLTHEQDDLLRAAAALRGKSLSSFVVDAAMELAREVMIEAQLTRVPAKVADQFFAWLDEPAREIPEMKRLAAAQVLEERPAPVRQER